jgi:hypothetical protein
VVLFLRRTFCTHMVEGTEEQEDITDSLLP